MAKITKGLLSKGIVNNWRNKSAGPLIKENEGDFEMKPIRPILIIINTEEGVRNKSRALVVQFPILPG